MHSRKHVLGLFIALILSGCGQVGVPVVDSTTTSIPSQPTSTAVVTRLWVDDSVPEGVRNLLVLPANVQIAANRADSNVQIATEITGGGDALWIYALVAPFPTVKDDIPFDAILEFWQQGGDNPFDGVPMMMSENTLDVFTILWGSPADSSVQVVGSDELVDLAWGSQPAWAIIPFEDLQPKWKVLRVDGFTPLDKNMNVEAYPLTVRIGINGLGETQLWEKGFSLPTTNRNPELMTTLVMTGTTALVRAIGAKMEEKGMTYPASDIGDWLRNADLTHISNEVSFTPNCPQANAYQQSLNFCSRPEYIELLEYVGTDIVELSGNHLLDWGREPFTYSMEMYRERGWGTYAGGENQDAARQPLLVNSNGNRFAFIGCNAAGPAHDWADADSPGTAVCDYDWMKYQIGDLKAQGILTIVTLQYFEIYVFQPTDKQREVFQSLAAAGAVIVSGSQAHFPQAFGFEGDSFIHYGLGNLFFDQMDIPVEGTRREFIDRHVFYDGRYVGSEILTAMLEDYSRPRPMNGVERELLLSEAFSASGW